MKQTTNLFLILVSCVAAYLCYFEYLGHMGRKMQLVALQQQISQAQVALSAERAGFDQLGKLNTALRSSESESAHSNSREEALGPAKGRAAQKASRIVKPPSGAEASAVGSTSDLSREVPEWLLGERVDQIARYVKINDDEMKMLTELAKTGLKGELSNAELIQAMEGIIGYERTFELIRKYREESEQKNLQRIDDEIYIMSRRFSLSLSQEDEVRRVLEEVQAELSSRSEENTEANDMGERSPVEFARQEREDRIVLLNAKLRDIFSDAQYQTLLEYQSSSDSTRFFP